MAQAAPKMTFVEAADLEHVRDFLVENGVDKDTTQVDLFSRNYAYGPSSFAGEISFAYSEVDGLRALLQAVLDEMEGRRGPNIQGARIVFLVEDCGRAGGNGHAGRSRRRAAARNAHGRAA